LEGEQNSWEPALAHELAHVKRRDDLWIQCFNMLKLIYFFHPLVWLGYRKCHHERERLCDRMVIQSGEMSPAFYGQGLLAVFSKQLPMARGLAALSPAAASVASRLTSLNQYRKGTRSSLLGTLFVLGLGLLMLPMAAGGAPNSLPDKDLVWHPPLENARTTSAYGYRIHPFSKEKKFHNGIDLVAPKGTWILAPADGVVLKASANYEGGDNYGIVIVLQHNDTYTSFFSHLDSVAVKPGQKVRAGARLGTMGSTGVVTAPHLHFEIWENGKPVDPSGFLREHE
jgi:murein DD-endopeptidase MepM/ murein hydrolase activator NlpD